METKDIILQNYQCNNKTELTAFNRRAGTLSDDVMRKKLLIDGEGIGDDRRLTLFTKTFLKWCNSDTLPEEEIIQTHERMSLMLDQCESAMQKSFQVQKTHQTEIENYDALYKSIENSLVKATKKINTSKSDLQSARTIRKNKLEYDSLAKVIMSEPDREKTLNKLHELSEQLNELQSTTKNLNDKIEDRRKQSHVLINAINQLLFYIEEDEMAMSKEEEKSEKMDVDGS